MRMNGLGALLAAIAGTWVLLLTCQSSHSATVGGGRPAEPPPSDFTAAQYIDSAGCVFVREGDGWTARQARDGTPICGYPPTLSARRTAPDWVTPLFAAEAEDEGTRIRRELTETIMSGLHTGELADQGGTTHPAVPAADGHALAEPQDHAPVAQRGRSPAVASEAVAQASPSLADVIAAVPQVRAGVAEASAGDHARELCKLLGGKPGEGGGLGVQDTLGMCGGMEALVVQGRARAVPHVEAPATANAAGNHGTAREPAAQRGQTKTARKGGGAANVGPAKSGKAARGADPFSATPLIPAGARFVQVGMFRNRENAERAARKLSAMGLPVSQGQGSGKEGKMRAIMAGPFDSRQAIVRALDRVRKGGFPDAYPR